VKIAVLVKQVPDTYAERTLRADDGLLDRAATDAIIDEIDTRGVEAALQLRESEGGEVTVVTMGPASATDALRKALAMGADSAVHVQDDALAGACVLQTSTVLAAALRTLSPDLVVTGNESTDGRTGALASMLAERLGLPQATLVHAVAVVDGALQVERVTEAGAAQVAVPLPALVSVSEKLNEPRYPNFKGIMAAKKKPVTVLSLTDLGLDPSAFGLEHASTKVLDSAPRPPKAAGVKIADGGSGDSGAAAVFDHLVAARLV
jgi:electron transfer flavoprotein beta subunit